MLPRVLLPALFLVVTGIGVVPAQNSKFCIIDQPRPELPEDYGTRHVQGSIVLRIIFLDTGEIRKISLVSGLIDSLNKLAISGAEKIKFRPEVRDGKAISVTKTIQYLYGWEYSGWKVPKRSDKCR